MELRRKASANRSSISATCLTRGRSNGHDNMNNCRGGPFRPDARRFPGDLNLPFRPAGDWRRFQRRGLIGQVGIMCMETFIRISRLAGQGRILSRSRPSVPRFRTQSCSGTSQRPAVHSAALRGVASMERYMRISRSRSICLSCGRPLPRAAARCPWCIASVVVAGRAGGSPAAAPLARRPRRVR